MDCTEKDAITKTICGIIADDRTVRRIDEDHLAFAVMGNVSVMLGPSREMADKWCVCVCVKIPEIVFSYRCFSSRWIYNPISMQNIFAVSLRGRIAFLF